jgi:hypothetical protein
MRSGSDGLICTTGVRTFQSGSDRSDLTRTRPTAGRSPEIGFRGGASPELLKSDAPGVKTTRARVRDGLRDMGNPPRATAGLGRPLSGDIDGGRGFARRHSPACDAPGVAVALKLRGLAQQVEG